MCMEKTLSPIWMFAVITFLSACGGGGDPSAAAAPVSAPTPGVLALDKSAYTVEQGAGTLTVNITRASGSQGAVSVGYTTMNGTAIAGTDYTSASGTLDWGDGDVSTKSFTVTVSNAIPLTASKSFNVALSNVTGGATLGAPNTASVTITPAGGGIALSASSYSVQQSGASITITVDRTGGSAGASSVQYTTTNGSAVAGTDYTAASGTLNWASGDSAAKTFSVSVSNANPYAGSKSFSVDLSNVTGSTLGTPTSATVTITGSATSGSCAKNGSSYVTTGAFDFIQYGNYVVNNNNWGGTPGQQLWANNASCWGVTTTSTVDGGGVGSYPSVTRGWEGNATMMQQLSTPGTNDWTTKSGMGISVTALTQAKTHWTFMAPTTGTRWMGLMDIYFHKTPTPDSSQFPPFTDLMVDQSLQDQVINTTTFYAATASQDNATTVTLGGNRFVIYIDDSGELAFHNGGHTIHLFLLPTAFSSNNANPIWGQQDAEIDIKAIIDYLMQSNPVDDAGTPLKTAAGTVVTSPLITSDLYLNAVNAGWEIDTGTAFTNTNFCLAMQSEPACP